MKSTFDWLKNNIDLTAVVFLMSGLLLGATATYLGMEADTVSQQQAAEELVSTLERQSGTGYTLVGVSSSNGLYEVNLRDSNGQGSTVFTSRDGELFSTTMTSLENLNTLLEAQDDFSQCLQDNNVTMYGNASQRATAAQIQLMGGQRTVAPIYEDLNNNQVLREARQAGVQQVPSIVSNGSMISGPNQLNQVEQFTGCELSAGQ